LLSSPRLSADGINNVIYSTFDEFQASLMNFTGLLKNNIIIYQHDETSSDFIETRVRDRGETLLHYVTTWLESHYSGLIIYGGYGFGKTTFSLYLASLLSKKIFR
jgi:hypothetical protein